MDNSRIPMWAHRGYSAKYPENTMVAFVAAVERGFDGIECDVHETSDGHFILMHDESVNRTTSGSGLVKQMSLADVEALDAGRWMHDAFRGVRVPRLQSLLAYIALQKAPLTVNIEWKTPIRTRDQVRRMLHQVDGIGLTDAVIHSSFDTQTLACIGKWGTGARLGLLIEHTQHDVFDTAKHLRAEAIHLPYQQVTPRFCRQAHTLGMQVRAYAVEDAKAYAWIEACGVDAVMTDRYETGPA